MIRNRISTRNDLAAYADRLLHAVRPFASPHHSLITLPGTTGGYGTRIDGLEGFTRTLLAAGFRLAGERGNDPHGYLEWYARGIDAGTDPHHPDRWLRTTEHGQAKVEAASLALVLDLTRAWLWDSLDPRVQEQVVDYLAEVVGDEEFAPNNWLWFRVVTETFLRSVGGPHSLDDIASDLERHDSYYERDGWYRDGAQRSYDHYTGWAMHLYPTLWARMAGAQDLAAPRAEKDLARLDRYLTDLVHLVGGDGAPLPQGRSLVYRYAAAAPLWAGALAQVPSTGLGLLRDSALAIVDHFASRGVPNARGLLDLGWHGPWRHLAQSYSGTGSPYWASKGLLGLALPADHPVWSAPVTPLASRQGDHALALAAPVWAVSSTASDGIVRLANHGTDHTDPGAEVGDSPLYARLAYSTATFPLHRGIDWREPLDQSVVLVDGSGRRSHRAGMTPLGAPEVRGDVVIAGSRSLTRWIDAAATQTHHGNGITGEVTPAGTLTVLSVLRGAWEVRLVHVGDDVSALATALECGGWALADDAGVALEATETRVDQHALRADAALVTLAGWEGVRVEHRNDASPLGAHACVAVAHAAPAAGWSAVAIGLAGKPAPHATSPLEAAPAVELTDSHAVIAWAQGTTTEVALPLPTTRRS